MTVRALEGQKVKDEQTKVDGVQLQTISRPAAIRYTLALNATLAHAESEALLRNQTAISVVDLLAGLCESENTRAERIANLKANAQYLRWLARLPQLPCPDPSYSLGHASGLCDLDSEARRALSYAIDEASRDGEYWIDTDHLLRGLLRFANQADFALLKLELRLEEMREDSRHDRELYHPEPAPHAARVNTFVRKHMPHWAAPVIAALCLQVIGRH